MSVVNVPQDIAISALTLTSRSARVAVAVSGPDAAGKSTIADEVAAYLPGVAVRISIDDFHRPRRERYRRGETAEAYLDDTFGLVQVQRTLDDFQRGASEITAGIHDLASDEPRPCTKPVPAVAVLVMDGVFLLRRELVDRWDLSVYLDVPESVIIERARVRDSAIFGGPDEVERRYQTKYLPGQQLYRSREQPVQRADLVIDTRSLDRPRVLVDRRAVRRAAGTPPGHTTAPSDDN